jgi:hypothetical protein
MPQLRGHGNEIVLAALFREVPSGSKSCPKILSLSQCHLSAASMLLVKVTPSTRSATRSEAPGRVSSANVPPPMPMLGSLAMPLRFAALNQAKPWRWRKVSPGPELAELIDTQFYLSVDGPPPTRSYPIRSERELQLASYKVRNNR